MGVGTVIGAVGRNFFAAFLVFIPVVKTVLLVGINMALLFFTAPGDSK
jgi:hypothetical protein